MPKSIFCILFLCPIISISQNYSAQEFRLTPAPSENDTAWRTLDWSKFEFKVKMANTQLLIERFEDDEDSCGLRYGNGTLVGYDHGEFGGRLEFVPDDTAKENLLIKFHINVKAIFRYNNSICFLEGLSHMGLLRGGLYELDTTNNAFNIIPLLDFKDAPDAYTIYHNDIYIATSSGFCIVHNGSLKWVCKKAFWDGLYPNSVAVQDEENVFIGIRSGYVNLNTKKKKLRFYKYVGSN